MIPHCMNDPQPEGQMASYIGRRKFLATLGRTAAARPLAARAQQGERMRRIGILIPYPPTEAEMQARMRAFREELRKRGWAAGKDRLVGRRTGLPLVSPIKSHPKEKPKWHIRCTTRL